MIFHIKEIRHKRNLSVEQLSKLAIVGKATISDAENGKTIPCLITLCKLARVLEVGVCDLFETEEKDFE